MKNYIYLLTGLGIFCFILICFGVYLLFRNSSASVSKPSNNALSGQKQELFKVADTTQQHIQSLSIVSPINLVFDFPIQQGSFVYEVFPETSSYAVFNKDNTTVSIRPKKFWLPNVKYSLIINQVKTTNGKILLPNYTVVFRAINGEDGEKENSNVETSNKR